MSATGTRGRLLGTQAGDVGLRIPKLGKGSLLASMLEPRRRIDRALGAVVMEAYVAGVSTRSVDDLVAALGAEGGTVQQAGHRPPGPIIGSSSASMTSHSSATHRPIVDGGKSSVG